MDAQHKRMDLRRSSPKSQRLIVTVLILIYFHSINLRSTARRQSSSALSSLYPDGGTSFRHHHCVGVAYTCVPALNHIRQHPPQLRICERRWAGGGGKHAAFHVTGCPRRPKPLPSLRVCIAASTIASLGSTGTSFHAPSPRIHAGEGGEGEVRRWSWGLDSHLA